MINNFKILVIGAVKSTETTISSLLKHNFDIVGILGHEPLNRINVSGLADLDFLASRNNIDYLGFKKINDKSNISWARNKKPDIIFAVGFSQLLSSDWLKMPSLGCIGFHPTCLPKGRGRAPIAWAIIEERCASASFFLMGEGADDGPVFIQEQFSLNDQDDASTVERKINFSIDNALDHWLPELKLGIWNPKSQEGKNASWYGKRTPKDGLINWYDTAFNINRLIKASTHPHPGAFTFRERQMLSIWSCEIENKLPIKGVVGRILLIDKEKGHLIQSGEGLLWINDVTDENGVPQYLMVGEKLGLYPEIEIHKLWKEIEKLTSEEK